MLESFPNHSRRRKTLQLPRLQRRRNEIPEYRGHEIAHGENHAGLKRCRDILRRWRVRTSKVAAVVQTTEDLDVLRVGLCGGDGVEDAGELEPSGLCSFDDFVDDRGVITIENMVGAALFDRVVVFGARDGDHFDASGSSELDCHGSCRGRSSVHD